ncbi:hypothetical protein C8R44DRAFT_889040 [Mycena epipterygia]|nr:hypothetical protein C8R44DRAFT_889040 [Mycena epipterygia]
MSDLRVWGCLAYVPVQRDKRDTSGCHFQRCIFMGYPTEYKGWSFYNPVTQKIVTGAPLFRTTTLVGFPTPLGRVCAPADIVHPRDASVASGATLPRVYGNAFNPHLPTVRDALARPLAPKPLLLTSPPSNDFLFVRPPGILFDCRPSLNLLHLFPILSTLSLAVVLARVWARPTLPAQRHSPPVQAAE